MSEDVVAALDRWLDNSNDRTTAIERRVVVRARDEIVRLRKLTDGDWVWKQITGTRDAALEEAARICEGPYTAGSTASTLTAIAIAKAIRALKEKRDE